MQALLRLRGVSRSGNQNTSSMPNRGGPHSDEVLETTGSELLPSLNQREQRLLGTFQAVLSGSVESACEAEKVYSACYQVSSQPLEDYLLECDLHLGDLVICFPNPDNPLGAEAVLRLQKQVGFGEHRSIFQKAFVAESRERQLLYAAYADAFSGLSNSGHPAQVQRLAELEK